MANVTLVAGHIPNYVNPVSRQPLLLGVNIGMTALAVVCVALRVYTRRFLRNIMGAEDWVVMFAALLATIATICTCLGCKLGGTGLHYWDIPPTVNKKLNQELSYVNQFLYQPILQLTKISILLFYTSLSHAKYLYKSSYAGIGICTAFCIACTVVEVVQCSPVRKSVYGASVPGKCIFQPNFFIATGFVNLFLDLMVLALPLPLLWRLQAPLKQRVALMCIFCVGIFVCICSIVRITIWFHVIGDGNRNNPDSSWTRVEITNWSAIEYCAGLICSSLPHLRPLITKAIPGFLSTNRTRTKEGYNSNLGSKKYRIPVGSTDGSDAFYGSKKGHQSSIVTGGITTTRAEGHSDADSTDEIYTTVGLGVPTKEKENWHIMKTIKVDVQNADDHSRHH